MEKLIELLNEYTQNNYKELWIMEWCKWNDFEDKWWLFFVEMTKRDYTMEEETLISKKFWFIEWLVENDKINMGKARYHWDKIYYKEYWEWDFCCTNYEFVIMLLAISDTPIEYLISLLK